jgi:hypothetical protein
MRQTRVRLEINTPAPLLQLVGRHLAPSILNNRIRIAMAHENRRVLVRRVGRNHLAHLILQQQVARQAENSAQLRRARHAGHQAHGTALAETAQHDALGGDSGVDLGLDEGVEDFLRAHDAGFVVGAVGEVAEVGDVVPAGHAHAAVDCDGDARRVREDELRVWELSLGTPLLREKRPDVCQSVS